MATMTVSVPDDVKDYVEAHVGEDFADAGAFLAKLVRRDRDEQLEDLRRIVDDALASGISTRTTQEIFAEAVETARLRGTLRD